MEMVLGEWGGEGGGGFMISQVCFYGECDASYSSIGVTLQIISGLYLASLSW